MKPASRMDAARAYLSGLTVEQAAEYLGLSKNAVYGLRYSGGAPVAIRVGRRLRFRSEDLEAWLNESRIESARPV